MSMVERALRRLRESSSQDPTRRVPIATVRSQAPPTDSVDASHETVPVAVPQEEVHFNFSDFERAGLLNPNEPRFADQYRLIKLPLLRKAAESGSVAGDRLNLVMVTSALAGEGKTFTSLNLAMNLARERDWTVLLVDSDCHRPQLTRQLGAETKSGFLDLLRDKTLSWKSVVLRTNVPGLSVMPVGSIDEHSAELIGSDRMKAFGAEVSRDNRKRIVLFDSTPLLLTPEAAILGREVGQVLVVVQASSTPRSAVVDALQKLDSTKTIGMILNRVDDDETTLRYGGYYAAQPLSGS